MFWNGVETQIQNSGGSSLAVVLTWDCLSLLPMDVRKYYGTGDCGGSLGEGKVRPVRFA